MQTNLEQQEDQHLLVVFVVQAVGSGQSKSVANLRRDEEEEEEEEMRSFEIETILIFTNTAPHLLLT